MAEQKRDYYEVLGVDRNADEATIKKGKKSDYSILLQPLNSNYEPLIFTKEEMKTIPVTIIGIVKQLKRKF